MEESGADAPSVELIGEHRYQLDAKGRIALPRRFHEALRGGGYVTLGQDECLWLFPDGPWREQGARIARYPLSDARARRYSRMFFGKAERIEPDGQGRVVIPQRLRSELHMGREVVVVGVSDHLEIWDLAVWSRYEDDTVGSYRSGELELGGPVA